MRTPRTAAGATARNSSQAGRRSSRSSSASGRELDYRLIKEVWAFHENRIAVRFAYEWHDAAGAWYRSYGNEQWEFAESGLMRRREASINDVPIAENARQFRWEGTRRPDDHPGLTELGL